MAVGKTSMMRASKAVKSEKTEAVKEQVKADTAAKTDAIKSDAKPKKEASKPAGRSAKKTVADKNVIAAPSKEVLDKIIYQPSAQVLERDAEPNESFGLGDAMPVYFL